MPNRTITEKYEQYLRQQKDLSSLLFNEAPERPLNNQTIAEPIKPIENLDEFQKKIEATMNENDWKSATTLDELNSMIHSCKNCSLGDTRTNFVFGVGNPNAKILIIGEAPGNDEDLQGEPFVGRAGQLLNKILESVGFKREEVYICNILKCRPPNNRVPLPSERDECEPYLHKQIDLVKPSFIIALGLTAVDTLMKTKHTMANIRGTFMDYRGYKMLVTYHPAALLRNPNLKKPVWEDMKMLRRMYDELEVK